MNPVRNRALRISIRAVLSSTLAVVPGVVPSLASAQQVVRIEEVLVTATKRGQTAVQDVPISIRALTSEDLLNQNITQFTDWSRFVPGVTFRDLGPGEKTIVTRGLASTGAATTAVYFDEAVITAFNDGEGGGRNVDFKLYDVERIEILRGPQGSLYGGSALGGLVRIVPAQPDSTEFSGDAEASISDTANGSGNYMFHGHFNLPLVGDRLALRLVGWYEDYSGYVDQARFGLSNTNDEETTGARAMLRFDATDRIAISAFVQWQDQQIGGVSRFNPVGTVAQQLPDFTGPPLIVDRELQNTDFTQNPRSDEAVIYSLKAEWEFNAGSVVAVSNWYERDFLNNFDSTPILLFFGVPITAISSFPEDRTVWSNEVRFNSKFNGPFQILTGLYYAEEHIQSESNVFTVDENGLIDSPTPNVLSVLRDRNFEELALFGELTYDFNERWSATLGARFAEFDFVTDENAVVPFFGPPTGPEPTKSGDDSSETFKGNLSFKATEDALLYLTVSEGFRRGGLNLNAFGDLFDIPETFTSDSVTNYEIGAKTEWLDGRLIVNATLYSIDWDDIQVETVTEAGGIEFFTNAGAARVDGIEFELQARPMQGLDLSLVAAFSDALLTEDQPPISADPDDPARGLDGDPINNVPDLTFAASAQYEWPWFSDYDGFTRVDYSYTDGSNTTISPRNPSNVQLNSYDLVNLQFGIRNEAWRVTVFADNVFDERPQNDAINDFTNILAFVTSRPRTIGVRAGYRF
jgi:outer membrane receptor protein involved in Fe transport